jgi:hypothetical protein
MAPKTQFLQIRVTPAEKAKLKRLAASAGQDVSGYVLARALPPARLQFDELLLSLRDTDEHRFALAELNDLLTALASVELHEAVEHADVGGLSPFLANYVAAMVEQAAQARGLQAPAWTRRVPPLPRPHFATPMPGLRLHLLKASPVPFRRRNLFVDAAVGARV